MPGVDHVGATPHAFHLSETTGIGLMVSVVERSIKCEIRRRLPSQP